MFNKYEYLESLQQQISELDVNQDKEMFLHEELDRAVIWYSDCWDICKEFNAFDFETTLGKAENLSQLAYGVLYEYVYDNLEL